MAKASKTHRQPVRRTWNMRGQMMIGLCGMLFLGGAVGIWGSQTTIAGAVLGKGTIEASDRKVAVQHPIGGVVDQILARNGDHVTAGQILLRLDDYDLRAQLAIIDGQLFELLANQARLEAVIDSVHSLTPHPLLHEAAQTNPEVAALLSRKETELEAHYQALTQEDRLLARQIDQVAKQIAGVEAQLESRTAHMALLEAEMERSEGLAEKGLLNRSVMFDQQKDALNTRGEIGRLQAWIAELNVKIAELDLKRQTLAPGAKIKASEDLSRLRPDRAELLEKRAAVLHDLTLLDVRAPIDGTVHDSQIEGLRSVVVKAKTVMSIIPSDAPVLIQVRIDANDIDQVFVGQETSLRFSSFSHRSTPIVFGDVTQVSADAFLDPVTRKPYYEAYVDLRRGELERLEGKELIPGMPVEAFIATTPRTPLTYVLKPLKDYFDRAFRDT